MFFLFSQLCLQKDLKKKEMYTVCPFKVFFYWNHKNKNEEHSAFARFIIKIDRSFSQKMIQGSAKQLAQAL